MYIYWRKNMYHRIEFWRSLPSLSSAITTFYWVWICFMAYLLSLLLIPKSFLNFWHFFYWLGKNFFCSQKKPYGDSFIDWWCWLSKIYKNISQKCEIFFWNLSLCRNVKIIVGRPIIILPLLERCRPVTLCPSHYYAPRIFRPCDGPAIESLNFY